MLTGGLCALGAAALTNLGTLAFYVPAPNPPFVADSQGRPLEPQRLLEEIGHFDFAILTIL
jgi:hypothetical protein